MSALKTSFVGYTQIDHPPYTEAQRLDPLYLDGFMPSLPDLIRAKCSDALLNQLRLIVPCFDPALLQSIPHCFAALRDLDFIVTAAHICDPYSYKAVAEIEVILQLLGGRIDHSPRGCNFTYGLFNPADQRMRTFTGLEEERIFIHAIQQGTRKLDEALLILEQLATLPLDAPTFAPLVNKLSVQFDAMTSAVIDVFRKVPPEVFSLQIVRFFIPLEIAGQIYPGITGAQIQNAPLDFILFGADIPEESYQIYAARNMSSMLPFQKAVIARTIAHLDHGSLLSRCDRETSGGQAIDRPRALASLAALEHFLKRVLSFRWAHRKLALTNLPLRSSERGSGGYTLDFLEYLIHITQDASQRIETIQGRIA